MEVVCQRLMNMRHPYWLEFVVFINSRLTWWKPGSSGIAACGAGAGEQEGG